MTEQDIPEHNATSCGEFFDKAEDPEPCKCRGIVLRTYDSLMANGVSEGEAIKVATNVLKYHHPCASATAKTIVECWVHKHSDGQIH